MGDAPGPARRDRALDQVLRIIEGVGVVDTAETGARTGLVAALDAVLGHVLAATDVVVLLVTDQVGGGLLVNGDVLENVGGRVSDLMSMCQPVRRAARRAFWPSLPMASESWSSGTITPA